MPTIPCRIAIQNLFVHDAQPRVPREVIEALQARFPGEWTDGTVRAHLIGLSTNHPSAHYYPHLQTFAFLTQTTDGRYALASGAPPNLHFQGSGSEEPIRPRAPEGLPKSAW